MKPKGLAMKRTVASLGMLGCLALVGCSAPNVITPTAATSAPSSAAPTPSATPTALAAAFGDSVTFPDGVRISVTASSSPASQYAAGAINGRIVTVAIKITNGSSRSINGALMSFPRVSYGATGIEALGASDVENGHGDNSVATVLPGETQTATSSFGVPVADYGSVRAEISGPAYGDMPAIFKGAIH